MEGWILLIVLLCLILFPTATLVILVIVGGAICIPMCWPAIPVLAILGATMSAASSKIKEK